MKIIQHAAYTLESHIVWVPQSCNSGLVTEVAGRVRTILHERADDKALDILELIVQPDHIHSVVSRPSDNESALLANWVTPPVFARARTPIDTPITTARHSAWREATPWEQRGQPGTCRARRSRTSSSLTRTTSRD